MGTGATHSSGPGAKSPNFGHLYALEPALVDFGARAERYVFDDPNAALFKLRQFGEHLAQQAAAYAGLYASTREPQLDLLRRLRDEGVIDHDISDLFHTLRKAGNRAVHEDEGTAREALRQLQVATRLGVWFQRGFGNRAHKAGRFVPPPNPRVASNQLQAELQRLRQALAESESEAEALQHSTQQQAKQLAEAEARAKQAYADSATSLALAEESEQRATEMEAHFEAQLASLQSTATAEPQQTAAVIAQAQTAAEELDYSEAETRVLIDAQLRKAGWEADTTDLCFSNGTRPTKGRNIAIAEWPTASGPADYVLFVGTTAIAVVEAKRMRKDVAGAIDQPKRYSQDYVIQGDERLPGGPWGAYKIPFLFATNGRRYIRQLRTKSGIWFLDARRPTNHPDPLDGWYTPEGLKSLLGQDHDKAESALNDERTDYLGLRDYQLAAIKAAEEGIREGRRELLLAMATGTGKTRTALGLMYRLIKTNRFRRVLFLVDRTSLGLQAESAFKNVKLENLHSLDEIYDVKGLGDIAPDPDTRLQVATVQGMVKRIMYASDPDDEIPVDRYDCIIVDESHRGYNLDKEMSDSELTFRNQGDYVSKYRRVLDHFDAVRIGLTATPALHTTQIFGAPTYQYTYRQAVVDGYLVDHEPPIRLLTELNQSGIHWEAGDQITTFESGTGDIQVFNTPDEIDLDVGAFNTKVITEDFNRVICDTIAKEIDPNLPGKTLVFCATDSHADLVVTLLKEAFTNVYGPINDEAVVKITGASDKPNQKILRYKNEQLPNVAVTVDLLTTGIDVPTISNLVFIRRVRSRILYEQMLGRATRLCPEIDKEFFRIYDAVDLYAALQDYSTMKPVVTRQSLSFAELTDELVQIDDPAHCESAAAEFLVKFHRRKNRLQGDALADFEALTGIEPDGLAQLLKSGDTSDIKAFFAEHPTVGRFLDKLPPVSGRTIYISDHDDRLIGIERGYGTATRPEDYLEGFKAFINDNINALPALMVVTQRPRELTRKQLKELKLTLDEAGYTAANLRTAWAETKNQDIAAGIMGFIRQQAIGSPLRPYDERVDHAIKRLVAAGTFSTIQRKWLDRIGSQLKQEVIVDRAALDRGQFKAQGGYNRLNKIFEGQLERVLDDLHGEVWTERGTA